MWIGWSDWIGWIDWMGWSDWMGWTGRDGSHCIDGLASWSGWCDGLTGQDELAGWGCVRVGWFLFWVFLGLKLLLLR